MNHGLAGFWIVFVVFTVSATTGQPGESPSDDPPFRKHDKTLGFDGPQHGLQDPTESFVDSVRQAVASVSTVGEYDSQASKRL